jgi:phosphatidylserine/phosphatidylglycerophosphate/cardiolipin synthase-like enzyme
MPKKLLLALIALLFASQACGLESMPVIVTVDAPPPTLPPVVTVAGPQFEGREIPVEVGYGYGRGFYEIYFTDPFHRFAGTKEGGIDIPLVAAIDQARLSLDVAAYSMSLVSVRNALVRAHRRGVTVRIVMESDNMERAVPQYLIDEGIEIIGDRRQGLMHNKFVIIDRSEVWLGSMNFTTSGAYDENNNLVRFRSQKIVENYLKEFNEMFEDDFFGQSVLAQTPNPRVTVDGIVIETYFSPDDKVGLRILELLKGAESSIHFLAFSFTTDDFAETIVRKAREGLSVAGVMDEGQTKSNTGGEFGRFKQASLSVYVDGNPSNMHHKVFIIDEKIVIFGSYNFSASAERRNDENVMIVFDPEFAAQFVQEFWRVYEQSKR